MSRKAIGNINDFKNFKVNMSLFNQDYNNRNNTNKLIFGGSDANNKIGMDKFLNIMLPKLQGGYLKYKTKKIKGGIDPAGKDFNFIRDVLSPSFQPLSTDTNSIADMNFKTYNFPFEQSLTRSSF